MYLGHQWVLSEFGITPRIGWQIDPFGHSTANAKLYADMGLEAIFFARADTFDIEARKAKQEMEWLWRPFFEHRGKANQVFAHTML